MIEITYKQVHELEEKLLIKLLKIFKENNIEYYFRAGSLLGTIRHENFIPWDTDIYIEIPINDYFKLIEIIKSNFGDYSFFYKNKGYYLPFIRFGFKDLSHKVIHIDVFPMIGLKNTNKKTLLALSKIRFLTNLYFNKNRKIEEKNTIKRKVLWVPFLILQRILSIIFPKQSLVNKIEKRLKDFDDDNCEYVVNPFSRYENKSIFKKEWYEPHLKMKFGSQVVVVPKEYDKILIQLYGNYMNVPEEKLNFNINEIVYIIPIKIYNKHLL